ncbi:alpha/beta-hydrolase [Hymenopellis radicata]|nr:alpha/beta-hydrolase [Hymenopellis radicata]
MLDPACFKDLVVSRGLKYRYYFSSPKSASKSYLLFLHGFPSSADDWRYQIAFFSAQGYGLVVPDMLGYGGTDKPAEAEAYRSSLITKDLVDILDKENAEKVVAIGHDLGAKINSRLANYHQDRFIAFAFYAAGCLPPSGFRFEDFANQTAQTLGYDVGGYWAFLSEDDAASLIRDHIDSFYSLAYAQDNRLSITEWSPHGALRKWLESNSTTEFFISQEDYNRGKADYLASGIGSSLNWYKIMTSDIELEDSKGIPEADYTIRKPVFFGGALRDYICVAPLMRAGFFKYAPNFTFQDYDTGHWIMLQRPEEINRDLLGWIESVVLP